MTNTHVPPPCPACGEPAKAADIRPGGSGQVTGSYICPAGHPWITKWAVVA